MFDIGFSELLLIAVVALVVLGPERLPKAARFAGLWVRRARQQWESVKQELENELEADELKRNLRNVEGSLREAEQQLREGQQQMQTGTRALHEEVRSSVDIRVTDEAPPPAAAPIPGENPPDSPAPSAGTQEKPH